MILDELALKTEMAAMSGDRTAVLHLVSALRKYRAAAKKLLGLRYGDGECDAVALTAFANEAMEAEEDLSPEE